MSGRPRWSWWWAISIGCLATCLSSLASWPSRLESFSTMRTSKNSRSLGRLSHWILCYSSALWYLSKLCIAARSRKRTHLPKSKKTWRSRNLSQVSPKVVNTSSSMSWSLTYKASLNTIQVASSSSSTTSVRTSASFSTVATASKATSTQDLRPVTNTQIMPERLLTSSLSRSSIATTPSRARFARSRGTWPQKSILPQMHFSLLAWAVRRCPTSRDSSEVLRCSANTLQCDRLKTISQQDITPSATSWIPLSTKNLSNYLRVSAKTLTIQKLNQITRDWLQLQLVDSSHQRVKPLILWSCSKRKTKIAWCLSSKTTISLLVCPRNSSWTKPAISKWKVRWVNP